MKLFRIFAGWQVWTTGPTEKLKNLLDAFLAYEGSDDLVLLQQAIVGVICRAYEMGRDGKTAETNIFPE